ncbi:substrate-binding periplasmic protein [Neptuniibacter halophilus]|uniref:substrate-binding periplasmic protein n=1 Tax=Neptuniibacter halophilus TaxID=651666 RepID=UPI00257244AE|nr:transporter substrate-binding domain-containing protein [Neptuniibacter halophilus]
MSQFPVHLAGKIRRACAIALTCLLLTPAVYAGDNTLRLTANEWPPYTSARIQGGGLVVELISAAFKRQGINTRWEIIPWNRALREVAFNQLDGMPAWYSSERARKFLYSDPILLNKIVLVKRKDRVFSWNTIEDLTPYTFVLLRGGVHSEEFDHSDKITRRYVSEEESAIKMVAEGRVDLTIRDAGMLNYSLQGPLQEYQDKVEMVTPALSYNHLYFMVSRNHPRATEIIDTFNKGLKTIKLDGTMTSLKQQYGFSPDQAVE